MKLSRLKEIKKIRTEIKGLKCKWSQNKRKFLKEREEKYLKIYGETIIKEYFSLHKRLERLNSIVINDLSSTEQRKLKENKKHIHTLISILGEK